MSIVSNYIKLPGKLFLASALGCAAISGCSKEIAVDPKLAKDESGKVIVDSVPDAKMTSYLQVLMML